MRIDLEHKELFKKQIRLWNRSYIVGNILKKSKYVSMVELTPIIENKVKVEGKFLTHWPIRCWKPKKNFEIIGGRQ